MAALAQSPPIPQDQEIDPQTTEQDLLDVFKPDIEKLIQSDVRMAVDPEKIYQYANIRKNLYYWRGQQFLRRRVSDGAVVDWSPVDGSARNTDGTAVEDLYDFTINDIRGYGRKLIGVVANQPPNVKAQANKLTNDDFVRRAKKADLIAGELHGVWKLKKLCRKVVYGFWITGTQFAHTPFVADGDRYGWSEEPNYKDKEITLEPAVVECRVCGDRVPIPDEELPPRYCPNCQTEFGPEDYRPPETMTFPVEDGPPSKYANGCTELHLHSGLTVTTPFFIQELEDTPFLLKEEEKDKGQVLAAFVGKEKIYKRLREMLENEDSTATSGALAGVGGQYTRDIANSPTGIMITPRRNRWLFTEVWLRQSMYEICKQEVVYKGNRTPLREALRDAYPNGCKATLVADKLIELEDSRIDDEWAMAQPETAENAYPDPLCTDMMSAQDLTNHCANTTAQTLEQQIPQTFIDVEKIDMKARKKHHLPGSFIPVKRTAGQTLRDSIQSVTVAKPEPEMISYPEAMRLRAAENVNITPAVFGGGQREQTAYATNLKRNQAMLGLTQQLDALDELVARATFNGVRQQARHSGGRLPSQYAPSSESQLIDMEELLEGGWHIEPADTMPMTWAERRAELSELLDKGPQVTGPLGFMETDNLEMLEDTVIAIPGWKLPNSDARRKALASIRKLMKGKPIQKISQVTGKPISLPSIPVDEFEDDPMFVATAVRNWAQTEDAQTEREENPEGYANVIAWGKAYAGLAMQNQAPPPGASPAAPSGGPPPAPKPPSNGPPRLMPPPQGPSPTTQPPVQ